MSRFKLYYPSDEITTNLYTSGGEWMTLDQQEYVGLYHTYTTGETYTQATWNPKSSVQLIPYEQQTLDDSKNKIYKTLKNDQVRQQFKTPKVIPLFIKKQDILNGYVVRYFIKKHSESDILEINELQFRQWQSNVMDSKLYSAVSLTWSISGNINDEKRNGYFVEGVATKNQKEITRASKVIPELVSYLTNLTDYYIDNTFYIPADINGLDS